MKSSEKSAEVGACKGPYKHVKMHMSFSGEQRKIFKQFKHERQSYVNF